MVELALSEAEPSAAERRAIDDVVLVRSMGLLAEGSTGPAVEFDGDRIAIGGRSRIAERRHLVLPALHAVRDAVGWISPGAMNGISTELQVPAAEIYGVATFYELFALEDPGATSVAHVCDDTACRLAGGVELAARLQDSGVVAHPSPCLGLCDHAPGVFIQRQGGQHISVRNATAAAVTEAATNPGSVADEPHDLAALVVQQHPSLPLLERVSAGGADNLHRYRQLGGYNALGAAVTMGAAAVRAAVRQAGLTGRGGAAFPTAVKWDAVAAEPGPRHLVVNADESEPGTFKDRVLMEHDPFAVVEAMTIGGFSLGAEQGWIYIRGEYPEATRALRSAIAEARSVGLLGADVGGHGFTFDIELRSGAGAYICGEETALLNSIEGYRGEPRNKPPFPTTHGLFGQPTVINNVETIVNVNHIVNQGATSFAAMGAGSSTGSKLFCASGHVHQPGVVEAVYGTTLAEVLELAGGVVGNLRAVLLGGAAGSFVGADQLHQPLTIEAGRAGGFSIGSGVVMALNDTTNFPGFVSRIAEFFRDESCGQCVPCRVGTVRQSEVLHRIGAKPQTSTVERSLLNDIAMAMADASICGLGHTASGAILSALDLGLIGDTP
jgi:NADH-quinone oxidoreductase subunit F